MHIDITVKSLLFWIGILTNAGIYFAILSGIFTFSEEQFPILSNWIAEGNLTLQERRAYKPTKLLFPILALLDLFIFYFLSFVMVLYKLPLALITFGLFLSMMALYISLLMK